MIAESTSARLSTLEAFNRLGSGFDISARDLEMRGAGDLLGEEKAGHVHLIGSALYQQLLEQALTKTRNSTVRPIYPAELNLGTVGTIPIDYVPEAVVLINLYARLQRLATEEELRDFADEIEDRFGPRPNEVFQLLTTAHLALVAGARGIKRIDAGPLGIAVKISANADVEDATAGF